MSYSTLSSISGDNPTTLIMSLTQSFGNDVDKKALTEFVFSNFRYDLPKDRMNFFSENIRQFAEESDPYIYKTCFKNLNTNSGVYVVQSKNLDLNIVLLFSRIDSVIVRVNIFNLDNDKWFLDKSISVKIADNMMHYAIDKVVTTTPNGKGNTYNNSVQTFENRKSEFYYFMLLFCFITNECI